MVLQHSGGAEAEVYLWGATLTSYKSAGGKENIFMSPAAIFDGKKAIRGGVPVVFPQFGQPDKAMPQHGFARVSMWSLGTLYVSNDSISVSLNLQDNEDTRAKWPHAFKLDFLVTLKADSLTMCLRVTNLEDEAFAFQSLLHTYFAVPDIGDVAVEGLTGLSYLDKVSGDGAKEESRDKVDLPAFTDSVYLNKAPGPKEVTISTKGGVPLYTTICSATMRAGAQLHPDTGKPCDVVVWNPYEGASPGDLPPPAFRNFVCVEPGLVGEVHDLPAKRSVELEQVIIPK